jgi:hypothetical protein
VKKYRIRFYTSLAMFLPILVLIWIIPYVAKDWTTKVIVLKGVPLYVYLNAIFGTIIQVFMGYPFYISAIKSLR